LLSLLRDSIDGRPTVTDAQGAALNAVRVTAATSSDATATSSDGAAPVVTFSQADGTYTFASLLPGTYRLTFERSGFRRDIRDQVQLRARGTATVSVTLEIAGLREAVAVTPEPSLVGTGSTKLVTRLSAEKLAAVPSATDMWAVLGHAEGVSIPWLEPSVGVNDCRTQSRWLFLTQCVDGRDPRRA
jgi:hypothetical protein